MCSCCVASRLAQYDSDMGLSTPMWSSHPRYNASTMRSSVHHLPDPKDHPTGVLNLPLPLRLRAANAVAQHLADVVAVFVACTVIKSMLVGIRFTNRPRGAGPDRGVCGGRGRACQRTRVVFVRIRLSIGSCVL